MSLALRSHIALSDTTEQYIAKKMDPKPLIFCNACHREEVKWILQACIMPSIVKTTQDWQKVF